RRCEATAGEVQSRKTDRSRLAYQIGQRGHYLTASFSDLRISRLVKFSANLSTLGVTMKLARDIMSLSTFKRDSNKVMRQMKKTKAPVVLTVNGKAAVVVQDAESYQRLLELKERTEVVETLRQRLASLGRKKGRPVEDFFTEFFVKHNIPAGD